MFVFVGLCGLLIVSGATGFLTSPEYGSLVLGSGLICFSVFGRKMMK